MMFVLMDFCRPICISKDIDFLKQKQSIIVNQFIDNFCDYLTVNKMNYTHNDWGEPFGMLKSYLREDNSKPLNKLTQALRLMTMICNDFEIDLCDVAFSGSLAFYRRDDTVVIDIDSFFNRISKIEKNNKCLSKETRRYIEYLAIDRCFGFDIVPCEFGDYLL